MTTSVTIEELPAALAATLTHLVPAMKDGDTVNLTVQQMATIIIALVVDTAPGTLDTLNELAAALGDDPNFAATITAALATKLNISGSNIGDAAAQLAFRTAVGSLSRTGSDIGDAAAQLVFRNAVGALSRDGGNFNGDAAAQLAFRTAINALRRDGSDIPSGDKPTFRTNLDLAWERIAGGDFASNTAITALNLSAYKRLRLRCPFNMVSTPALISLQVSTDNGATWISASDYFYSYLYGGESVAGSTWIANTSSLPVSPGGNQLSTGVRGMIGVMEFDDFNRAEVMQWTWSGGGTVNTGSNINLMAFLRGGLNQIVPRNALRITSAQAFKGSYLLEGSRT